MSLSRLAIVSLMLILAACTPRHNYTMEEKSYIAMNAITWCARLTSYPYEYLDDNGNFSGMDLDYINLISQKSGLRIKITHTGSVSECHVHLKNKSVHMMAATRATPERAEYATFTRPYIYVETVMLKVTNKPISAGIGKGFAVRNYLLADRKDLRIEEFSDDEHAVQAMLRGEIDSVIMDTESAKLLRKKYRLELDLITIPFEYPLSFAFRKEDAIPRQIFDKAISDITEFEHERIRRKWM